MSGTGYNLIIFHVPKAQSIGDFVTIRNLMAGTAPDIDVHIVSRGAAVQPGFWSHCAQRPTLLFSPVFVPLDPSVRGARIFNKKVGKLSETGLLEKMGFPVLHTEKIMPDTKLDERQWGPFVVVKPDSGSFGKGIRLERTRDVRWFDPRIYPRNDPRRGADMLAQQFVNTGPFIQSFRVFTVLGKVIYSIVSTATEVQTLPDPWGHDAITLKVAANGITRTVKHSHDEEILALAESIHRKFLHIPNMGIDIVREYETGHLFVLETNSRGNTWHLSSDFGIEQQRNYGLDHYHHGPLNALQTIADALIETTRKFAV